MPKILDQIEQSRRRVRPVSEAEFLALQIARILEDEQNASDYLLLSRRYTIPSLVHAYRSVQENRNRGWPAIDHFRAVLEEQNGKEPGLPNPALLAVRIERRCVALTYFNGFRLDYARTRSIPVSGGEGTITAFMQWALSQFEGATVVVERPEGEETKKTQLVGVVVELVRAAGVPLWEITPEELFQSFALPPCKTRGQFRAVANHLWPTLRTRFCGRAGLDAAALALLVQTKRLLGQGEVSEPAG